MAQRALEQRVENLEHRVETVDQILPTLATKTDIAELRDATKADLTALKVELTKELKTEWKQDIAAEGERTRRYFDIVAEGTRAEIRVVADGVAAGQESIAALRERFEQVDARHEKTMRILTRLAAPRKRRS
ncbi:MAG: hypothetical protein ABMA15_28155 [Vicinamibacterales bacterium]